MIFFTNPLLLQVRKIKSRKLKWLSTWLQSDSGTDPFPKYQSQLLITIRLKQLADLLKSFPFFQYLSLCSNILWRGIVTLIYYGRTQALGDVVIAIKSHTYLESVYHIYFRNISRQVRVNYVFVVHDGLKEWNILYHSMCVFPTWLTSLIIKVTWDFSGSAPDPQNQNLQGRRLGICIFKWLPRWLWSLAKF